jgi:putative redox protein
MPTEVTAKVSLIKNMHFHGENLRGMGAEMDSPPDGVGHAGASPMELILQAAGGCSLMDIAAILRKRQVPPEILEAEITGLKRDTHPKIYQNIEIVYRARGAGITLEELERAAGLSFSTYCSVLGMLKQVAQTTYRCELIE